MPCCFTTHRHPEAMGPLRSCGISPLEPGTDSLRFGKRQRGPRVSRRAAGTSTPRRLPLCPSHRKRCRGTPMAVAQVMCGQECYSSLLLIQLLWKWSGGLQDNILIAVSRGCFTDRPSQIFGFGSAPIIRPLRSAFGPIFSETDGDGARK